MINNTSIISATKQWITTFIIQHNVCPFAKHEYDNDNIAYLVIDEDLLENQLHALIVACQELDSDKTIETSLLILPEGLKDFDDYLDLLALANELMHKQGYEGVYQLASFHPDYCFEGVDADDASNYTNRSPYPMLHLIREASLEKALKNYPHPENIPVRNIKYLRELGSEQAKKILKQCFRRA